MWNSLRWFVNTEGWQNKAHRCLLREHLQSGSSLGRGLVTREARPGAAKAALVRGPRRGSEAREGAASSHLETCTRKDLALCRGVKRV